MVNVKPVQLGKTTRMSFGKINEALEMPNLIEVQKNSYQWFLDEGLKEVFRDVAAITDYNGNLVLNFVDYSIDDTPKYSVAECKERDVTYAAPLRVKATLWNKETGVVKENEVFMGDFPLMTDSGTFVINGAERVIVSQLIRSPGVYYGFDYDKTGKKLFKSTIIPNRGAWLVSAEITGRPIHASLRGFGENAIEKMVKVIRSIRELETKWMTTRRHPLLAPPTMNIGYIEGGVAASTVAEKCIMKFDVEYFPSEIDKYGNRHLVDKDEIVKEVEAHINLMAAGDTWLREHPIAFSWYQDCPPFETDIQDPLVQTLADAAGRVTGKRVISGMTAGCDARHLTNIAKVPTVVFGPGTCHNAHVVNEYLPVEQYFQAIETYMEMIREWTK